jgi:hypothetical protein
MSKCIFGTHGGDGPNGSTADLFPKFSDVVSFLAILRQDAAQQQKVQPAVVENWNFDLSARRLINKFSDGSIEGQQSKVDYFGRLFLA